MNNNAIYAGSFDPITNGHAHILKKAKSIFDKVFIVIANNPQKKYMFSLEERIELCEKVIDSLPNSSEYKVTFTEGYVAQRAKEINASYMVRGIRSVNDFQDEFDMYHINKKINSDIESVYLMPDMDLSVLRSSIVKSLIGPKGWIDSVKEMVHPAVLNALAKKFVGNKFEKFEAIEPYLKCYDTNTYHNWCHIVRCLDLIPDELNEHDKNSLFWALVFHDGKYEEMIVEKLIFDKVKIEYQRLLSESEYLIEATFHEDELPPNATELEKLIRDIDLHVLSWPIEKYDNYVNAVRQEYDCNDEEWAKGRKEVLNRFLSKPSIYSTKKFYNWFEKKARKNIQRELENLKRRV